jgi:4-diphosphocytidyl-2-C-methyl-D-erythritol kinase
MQEKSFTRLTLALDIIKKLDSGPAAGYHELGIIKHQIDLCDVITLESAAHSSLSCSTPGVPCDESNICMKALRLVQRHCSVDKQLAIHIQKRIPVMGGLAGGSANAATTLMMVNRYWQLGLGTAELAALGRELGMDVPFFFTGGTAFDSESTGVLRPLPNPVSFDFVLLLSQPGVSTAAAYGGIDYHRVAQRCALTSQLEQGLARGSREVVVGALHNDFELSVFATHPHLERLKQSLLEAGALGAVMSGSGSTLVGIARDAADAARIADAVQGQPNLTQALCCRTFCTV